MYAAYRKAISLDKFGESNMSEHIIRNGKESAAGVSQEGLESPALGAGPFPYRLTVGEDGASGEVKIGFGRQGMWTFNPFLSDCGRFEVDASEYGLATSEAKYLLELNALLDQATEDAINAGCLRIQKGLGELDGGFAGLFFSDAVNRSEIQRVLARYLLEQRLFMA